MYIKETEVAEIIGLSVHFLRSQRSAKPNDMIPYYKVASRVRYKKEEVIDWVEKRRIDLKN